VASVRVDAVGLTALADHCEQQAAMVGAIGTPPLTGGSQPSAAAVEAAHADVAAAGARLMARMQSTAAAASTAAAGYVSTDSTSANDLAVMGSSGITAV
jgi:hypothetical protein